MPQVDHADGPEADGEPGPPAAEAPAGPSAAAAAARSSVSGMLTYINNSKLAGSAPLVYVPPAALATPGAAATAQAGAAPPAGQAASGVKWVQPSGTALLAAKYVRLVCDAAWVTDLPLSAHRPSKGRGRRGERGAGHHQR